MLCPECDNKLEVLDTRMVGDDVYRRRRCAPCGTQYITQEVFTELDTIPSLGGTRKKGRPTKQPSVAAHNPFGL